MRIPTRFGRASLRAALLGCLVAAIPAGSADAAPCAGAEAQPTANTIADVRHSTLCLVNQERVDRGMRRLRSNPRLRDSAMRYAREMVDRGFFSHVSPTGATLMDRVKGTGYLAGAKAFAIGENLAWGSGSRATPRSIVDSWMHSSGHRANILNRRFEEAGFGVAMGAPVDLRGQSAATYANQFGSRG